MFTTALMKIGEWETEVTADKHTVEKTHCFYPFPSVFLIWPVDFGERQVVTENKVIPDA